MYRRELSVFALAFLASLMPTARADDKVVRGELNRLNAKLVDATRRKDTRATMALMTSDFRMKKTTGGWLNKAQTEALLRKSWPAITAYRSWRVQIREIKVSGNIATALVEDEVAADVKNSNGVVRPVVMRTIARQQWRRTNGVWQFRLIEDLKAETTAPGPAYVSWRQALNKAKTAKAARAKAGPKPGITTADARKMLERAYATSRKAFRAKDVAGVMASTTKDYTVESPASVSNRWQVEQELRKELKATKSVISWTANIGAINVTGNTLTAEISERKKTVILDSKGKPHTSEVVDTLRDVWIKTPSGWRNSKSIILSATVKVDGRTQ